jgi:hypothetical protein
MMKLSQKQQLFAHDVACLITQIFKQGYGCTLGECWRTKEQAEIYAKNGKGILSSLHCKRLAIDLNLFKDGVYLTDSKEYLKFGSFWESIDANNRWGGFFVKKYGGKIVDGNHFERIL